MKFTIAVTFLFFRFLLHPLNDDCAEAFDVSRAASPTRPATTMTTGTRLFLAHDSNNDKSPHKKAIQEALEATQKYGATSVEARVAWEIAEEIEDSVFSPCSKRCVSKKCRCDGRLLEDVYSDCVD